MRTAYNAVTQFPVPLPSGLLMVQSSVKLKRGGGRLAVAGAAAAAAAGPLLVDEKL